MSLDSLREAVRYGMKENLSIQFVFPNERVPGEHQDIIESVNHIKIKPFLLAGSNDVGVVESWESLDEKSDCKQIVIYTSFEDLINNDERLNQIYNDFSRINIVIKDIEALTIDDSHRYKLWLGKIAKNIVREFSNGSISQINILTDRLFIGEMRNCSAGDESITVAPNGQFYICPAFYYESNTSVGTPAKGLNIPNKRLYELNNAPICRECDAWHCKRCVWLNKKKTHEVNIPGRMQCIISHIERDMSRLILNQIETKCQNVKFSKIPEINYLDPFEKLI